MQFGLPCFAGQNEARLTWHVLSLREGKPTTYPRKGRTFFFPIVPIWAVLEEGTGSERAGTDGARADPTHLPGSLVVAHSSEASPRPAQERDIWGRGIAQSSGEDGHSARGDS